jgi:hypothetical protein
MRRSGMLCSKKEQITTCNFRNGRGLFESRHHRWSPMRAGTKCERFHSPIPKHAWADKVLMCQTPLHGHITHTQIFNRHSLRWPVNTHGLPRVAPLVVPSSHPSFTRSQEEIATHESCTSKRYFLCFFLRQLVNFWRNGGSSNLYYFWLQRNCFSYCGVPIFLLSDSGFSWSILGVTQSGILGHLLLSYFGILGSCLYMSF